MGKEYVKTVYCHIAYLTSMQSTSCKMPDWINHKLESRFPGEISTTPDMKMTEGMKNWRAYWWRWKRREKKLALNPVFRKLRLWHPVSSLNVTDGGKMEADRDFIFLDSKITANGDCSQEIKRQLLLGRKVVANLASILKSRDITLPTKVHLVKATVFPVVMYGWENES